MLLVKTLPLNSQKLVTILIGVVLTKDRNDRYGTRRMKKFNTVVLDITVAILDFLYRGRDYQRFWCLRKLWQLISLSYVLHFRESMGLRGPEHLYLMKEHFTITQ